MAYLYALHRGGGGESVVGGGGVNEQQGLSKMHSGETLSRNGATEQDDGQDGVEHGVEVPSPFSNGLVEEPVLTQQQLCALLVLAARGDVALLRLYRVLVVEAGDAVAFAGACRELVQQGAPKPSSV